jgi:HTH-type transcriptional regulator, transcriptional repressor of NAD biosynthesis genes
MGIHGLVLGRFLPPHRGHVHLCEVAEHMCDDLTIVVASLASEPIPGAVRVAGMRELFPRSSVVHHTTELPQEPAEHAAFWQLWGDSLRACVGRPVQRVFASDRDGLRLAAELGAAWIPIDPDRTVFPVSGPRIRREPMRYFDALPRCVRPHFVRRVSVFGPESTGKTTLSAELARACDTVCVPEFARSYLEARGGVLARPDIDVIGEGQIALEDALAREANRVLICDTDPLLAVVWSEVMFGESPQWLRDAARLRRYDLTLLCDIDLPWADDVVRYLPEDRAEFAVRCQRALRDAGRRYERIRGTGAARTDAARAAVRALGGTLKEDQG